MKYNSHLSISGENLMACLLISTFSLSQYSGFVNCVKSGRNTPNFYVMFIGLVFLTLLSDINCEVCVLGIISSILWFAFSFYFLSFNNEHNVLILLGPKLLHFLLRVMFCVFTVSNNLL